MGTSNVTLYAKWTAPAIYSLRDRGPAGGWIFYDKGSYSDGWRYLEVAPVDQTDRVWGTYNFVVTGADGIDIGTGKQNTLDIINNDTGTANKAANECADYSITNGGVVYDDWFLPSSAELWKMRENLDYLSVGGFANEIYFSSTEHDKDYANEVDFGGLSGITTKNSVRKVRAVRSF